MKPISRGYLGIVLATTLVAPLISIGLALTSGTHAGAWSTIGRWFVFWAVGLRLFTAGLRQVFQPAFTARQIFEIDDPRSQIIVRELGFANISMGLGAIASAFVPAWRPAAALIGGLYFGLAGFIHLFKKPASGNELIALVSDLFIFAVVATCFLRAAW